MVAFSYQSYLSSILVVVAVFQGSTGLPVPVRGSSSRTPPLPDNHPSTSPHRVAGHPTTQRYIAGMREAGINRQRGVFWGPGSGEPAHNFQHHNSDGYTIYSDALGRPAVRRSLLPSERRTGPNPNAFSGSLAMTVEGHLIYPPTSDNQGRPTSYYDLEMSLTHSRYSSGEVPAPRVMDPRVRSTDPEDYTAFQVRPGRYISRRDNMPSDASGRRTRGQSLPRYYQDMHNGWGYWRGGINPVSGQNMPEHYYQPSTGVQASPIQYINLTRGRKRDVSPSPYTNGTIPASNGTFVDPVSANGTITVPEEPEIWYETQYAGYIYSSLGLFAKDPADEHGERLVVPPPVAWLAAAHMVGNGSDASTTTFPSLKDPSKVIQDSVSLVNMTTDQWKTYQADFLNAIEQVWGTVDSSSDGSNTSAPTAPTPDTPDAPSTPAPDAPDTPDGSDSPDAPGSGNADAPAPSPSA